MIIDIHTHIFPPEIVADRESSFPGEPAFQLLYEDQKKSPLATCEDLIGALDAHQVQGAVTFGFPWKQSALIRRSNDYVLEAVRRFPHRLAGFVCLNPELPDTLEEAERCLRAGMKGIGELALYGSSSPRSWIALFSPLARLAAAWRVPLLLHTNEPVGRLYPGKERLPPWDLYELIRSFPETKFILAHWGGGLWWYQLLKREVREVLKNVYVDTAASPFLYRSEIYRYAIEILGVDKILFGSDYPLLKPDRYQKELLEARVEEKDCRAILGGNAQELLQWPSPLLSVSIRK